MLTGTTAFGKTIDAIKLIAGKKVNTVILADKLPLGKQWQNRRGGSDLRILPSLH
jgi:superfamily II DNA or RNA helicase